MFSRINLTNNLSELMRQKIIDWLSPVGVEGRGWRYLFLGANAELFSHMDQEIMLSGPADTGKTLAALSYLNQLAWAYPRGQWAIIRKYAATLHGSVVQTFQNKILRPEDGVIPYGGDRRPERYIYPNGSVIWLGGLDKASKVLSSERDLIYVNQAEELDQADWEFLITRANGRAGNMRIDGVARGIVIGDCNPAAPTHWILQRAKRGMVFLQSTHRDNPEIYDPKTGELTPGGEIRLAALQRLTGSTYNRLYKGLWAQPEGAIYDVYSDETHLLKGLPDFPRVYPRVVGVDPMGAYTAAVWVVYDQVNEVLVVEQEYYQPFGLTIPGHARNILELSGYGAEGELTPMAKNIAAWVGGGPSERQARVDYRGAGLPMVESPIAGVWEGIDRVYQLLRENRLFVSDECENLRSEIGEYRRKFRSGVATDEIEDKERFHLLDALRYAIGWLLGPQEFMRVGKY
jgi:phage terminase large subunit